MPSSSQATPKGHRYAIISCKKLNLNHRGNLSESIWNNANLKSSIEKGSKMKSLSLEETHV